MSNSTTTPSLQDDQRFALMKFRRSVSDVLKPEHDDYFLVRWLRARQWNAEAAEKMLRDSMKWRERMGVDTIDSWVEPEILPAFCPHGLCSYDKEGAPVIIVPFAGFDIWGILHTSVTKNDIVRYTIKRLEYFMQVAMEQSKTHGRDAKKVVVIIDMEGFNMKQYAWRPAAETIITLIKLYGLHYPEILKHCFIINAPKIFSFAFNIVKKFLDEYTLSKINIFKNDRRKWTNAILERIDASHLPQYYGGDMTDADGNPKCLEKICWGGKVPKEMYTTKEEHFNSTFTETNIKKGSKLKLTFDVVDEECLLKWEFRTYDHDIKFGVRGINNKTGEITNEYPLRRVSSHEVDEVGFITCQPNHKYLVVFDNSYSYFKNKKLTYSVLLSSALGEIEKTANETTTDVSEVIEPTEVEE